MCSRKMDLSYDNSSQHRPRRMLPDLASVSKLQRSSTDDQQTTYDPCNGRPKNRQLPWTLSELERWEPTFTSMGRPSYSTEEYNSAARKSKLQKRNTLDGEYHLYKQCPKSPKLQRRGTLDYIDEDYRHNHKKVAKLLRRNSMEYNNAYRNRCDSYIKANSTTLTRDPSNVSSSESSIDEPKRKPLLRRTSAAEEQEQFKILSEARQQLRMRSFTTIVEPPLSPPVEKQQKRVTRTTSPNYRYERHLSPNAFDEVPTSTPQPAYRDARPISLSPVHSARRSSYASSCRLRDRRHTFDNGTEKLVERLENMRRRATGNGMTACMLCGAEFGLFGPRSYAAMCHDCQKYVCQRNCGVETYDSAAGDMVFLCKICSEQREMWKKSGAWFYHGVPKYVAPDPSAARAPPAEHHQKPMLRGEPMRQSWVHARRKSPQGSATTSFNERDQYNEYSSSNENVANSYASSPSPYRRRARDQQGEMSDHSGRYDTYSRASSSRDYLGEAEPRARSGSGRRMLPTPPNESKPSRVLPTKPTWALEHVNRINSYGSRDFEDEISSSDDEICMPSRSQRPGATRLTRNGANDQLMRLKHRTDSEDTGPEDNAKSATPSSSPRNSLPTPSSSHGDQDVIDGLNQMTITGDISDTRSVDSGVVQSDQSHETSGGFNRPGSTSHTGSTTALTKTGAAPRLPQSTSSQLTGLSSSERPPPTSTSTTDLPKVTTKDTVTPLETASARLAKSSSGIVPTTENSKKRQSSLDEANSSRFGSDAKKRFIFQRPKLARTYRLFSFSRPNRAAMGSIEFTLKYNDDDNTLTAHFLRAKNLKAADSNGLSDPYVKVHLLPDASKSTKLRTKTIQKTLNPEWDEKLTYFGVTEQDKQRKILRVMVMDEDRIGSDFLGEYRVPLRKLTNKDTRKFDVALDEKQMPVEKVDQSVLEPGKILVSLGYDPKNQVLCVGILRCAELLGMDSSGYSDPYVKINLKPATSKKKHSVKTKTKYQTCNPEFNEDFNMPCPAAELEKKTLHIDVYDHDLGKTDDFIGGIVLGASMKGERMRHWMACIQNPNQKMKKWHKLMSHDQLNTT